MALAAVALTAFTPLPTVVVATGFALPGRGVLLPSFTVFVGLSGLFNGRLVVAWPVLNGTLVSTRGGETESCKLICLFKPLNLVVLLPLFIMSILPPRGVIGTEPTFGLFILRALPCARSSPEYLNL